MLGCFNKDINHGHTRNSIFSKTRSQNTEDDILRNGQIKSMSDDNYAQYFLKHLRQLREEDVLIDISFSQNDNVGILIFAE